MAAASRRRELRKKKILQNAEDRIKKLTENGLADIKREETLDTDVALCARQMFKNCPTSSGEVESADCEASETTPQKVKLPVSKTLSRQIESKEARDKIDGFHQAEKLNKPDEPETNENLHFYDSNVKLLDVDFRTNQSEIKGLEDKTENTISKENRHCIDQQRNKAQSIGRAGHDAVDSKLSMLRPVIVMILAIMCFTKSVYLPALSFLLGSPWFLQIYCEKEVIFILYFICALISV